MKVSASRLDNECEELQIYGNSDTVSSYPSLHPYYSPTDNEVPTFALPSNLENFSGEYSPKNIVPSTKRGTPLQFEKGRTDLRNLSETAFRNSNGALTYGDERKVPKSHTSGRVCCWIRWTRKRFIIFSLVTLLLSLTISLLVYFVFLPRAIRSAVQNGLGSSNLNLTTASVGGFTQKSVQLSLLASITAPMPGIQIPVHIDPFSISAKLIGGSGDLANQQPLLVNLALESPVDFKLGDAVVLNNTIQIDFSDSDNQALSDLVAQLSSEQGLSAGQKILAEMNINIKVAGIPLYSNFNLPVTIELSPMKGGGGLPTFIKADGVLSKLIR